MKRIALLFALIFAASVPVRAEEGVPKKGFGYLDLMLGGSSGTMDFTADSSLGSASTTGLSTNGSGVFGMRVGHFGEIFGGDFEFSFFNHGNLRQSVNINGYAFPGAMMPQDFIHVATFEMSGDLMMRFPTGDKVIPYFGLGMGLSMNNVTSDSAGIYLLGSSGARLNQNVAGFLFRVPFGVRFHVADPLDIFVEGRAWMNTFTFEQVAGVTDTISQAGVQFLGGVGLRF